MNRILISGANPYNGNKGVAALCYSIVYIVDEILKEIDKRATIAVYNAEYRTIADYLHFPDRTIAIQNIHPTIWQNWKSIFKLNSRWKLYNFREFLKSDIVLSVNAGDSFSDIYGPNIFNSINQVNNLALSFKKPLILLPQTYGPFKNISCVQRAKRIIDSAESVLCRDISSKQYAESISSNSSILELTDLAFFLPYNSVSLTKEKIHVGLNISALLWNGGYTQQNQFGITCDYRKLIKGIIDFFLSQENVLLHLIPHVLDDRPSIENDYQVSYSIWKEYSSEKLILSPFFFNPIEAKSYISSMDFFIGSRMHACIAAFSSGVPNMSASYSRKFSGLFNNSLGYKAVADLTVTDNNNALIGIINAYNNRNSLKQEVDSINKLIVEPFKEQIKSILKQILLNTLS